MPFTTGEGTDNEIVWAVGPSPILRLSEVPQDQPTAISPALPAVGAGGEYGAKWWLTPANGLTIEEVRYVEGLTPPHRVAEYLQWQNLLLLFDDRPLEGVTVGPRVAPVDLTPATCQEIFLLRGRGDRRRDGKVFSWAAGAKFVSPPIPDPYDARLSYTVRVTQLFLFAAPARDQDPGGAVRAVKVFRR